MTGREELVEDLGNVCYFDLSRSEVLSQISLDTRGSLKNKILILEKNMTEFIDAYQKKALENFLNSLNEREFERLKDIIENQY